VKSAIHLRLGGRRFEGAIEHVRGHGGRLPLTQIGRQATPSRTSFESLQPHQPLDPMQTARHAFCQQIAVTRHTRLAP
jgi:hypothetical protein